MSVNQMCVSLSCSVATAAVTSLSDAGWSKVYLMLDDFSICGLIVRCRLEQSVTHAR